MNTLKCKIPGCNKTHHAQGCCQNCYDNLRKKKKGEIPRIVVKPAPSSKLKDPKQHPEEPAAPARGIRRGVATAAIRADAGKSSRLVLIKARHEAIKREIDQIREDLAMEAEG